jgi:hypothetical protein
MAVLPKGGVQIAGHKVPWEAIAALAGVAGVILIIRARQQGSNVASVGRAPATAADAGFGSLGFQPDASGALANLSQQLTSLTQSLNGQAAPAPAPASTALPATQVALPPGTGAWVGHWPAVGGQGHLMFMEG